MSNPPVVSVVIPAYNAEKTILETIESVRKQTFTDFEILVINDGSTDQTVVIVNAIQDDRIKVFSYGNGGLSIARNRGIHQAQGEFITFLDADDLWAIDKLELQIDALRQHKDAGLVYSWTLVLDERGQNLNAGLSPLFEGNVYRQLLIGNFIASGSNAMLRRPVVDQVGQFDPTLRSSEDWDYWLRVATDFPFVVVPKPQIFYRQSTNTMSSNLQRMEYSMLLVHERAFKVVPRELKTLKGQSLSFIYRYLAKLYLTRVSGGKGVGEAIIKLRKAIQSYPKTLFDPETQKLIVKLVLIILLSPKLANRLLSSIREMRSTRMQSTNL